MSGDFNNSVRAWSLRVALCYRCGLNLSSVTVYAPEGASALYFENHYDLRKSSALLQACQTSPTCPPYKSFIKVKMPMERWWYDADSGKP
jgi:hypothetical protein